MPRKFANTPWRLSSVRKALSRLVVALGFRPALCATLAECRLCIIEQRPDFVILDLNLPDGSGLELLWEMGRKRAGSVIIVTAHEDDNIRNACLAAGARAFLVKPVHDADLSWFLQ